MDDLFQQLDATVTQIVSNFEAQDAVLVVVGALLLVFGRRLYWLALAGLGFAVALHLSRQHLSFDSAQQEILVGVVAGLLGGILAVVAQQLAVRIAGFVLGGWGTLFAVQTLWPDIALLVLVILAAAGAGLGFLFAAKLFELALVLVTSVVGALLIAQHLHLQPSEQAIVWLVLVLVGIAIQSRRRRQKLRMRPRDD